jgi:hypothetical protein
MSTAPRPLFTVQRLVISVLLAAALVTLVVAFTLHEEVEPVRLTHEAVTDVSPEPGDTLSLRQTEVVVQLKVGWVLDALQIQNRAVGGDDLAHVTGLNRWSFTPGEGKSIERFDPGRTCALAEFHATATPDDRQTFSWCFALH